MSRLPEISVKLIKSTGKILDLTDSWSTIEIIKNPGLYSPVLLLTTEILEREFLSTDTSEVDHIKISIKKPLGLAEGDKFIDDVTWKLKVVAQTNPSLRSSQDGIKTESSSDSRTAITFNCAPWDVAISRKAFSATYTNKSGQDIINNVLSGYNIKYVSPSKLSTVLQTYIPNMRKVQAISYICSTLGVYTSPTFFVNDFDGAYLVEVDDSIKNQKYLLHYDVESKNDSPNAYTCLAQSINVASNTQQVQFAMPTKTTCISYTHDTFYKKEVIDVQSLFTTPQLEKQRSTFDEITNDTIITTHGSQQHKNKVAHSMLYSVVIDASTTIEKFSDLRPGICIKFKSDNMKYKSLEANYILLESSIMISRAQNTQFGATMRLGRYGFKK